MYQNVSIDWVRMSDVTEKKKDICWIAKVYIPFQHVSRKIMTSFVISVFRH